MMLQDLVHQLPALLAIIGLNLLLSGDNALVIALVMRGLPPAQQRTGILVGTAGAVIMRILLTLGVWRLLELPGLRLVGGLTLLWMAWGLIDEVSEHRRSHAAPGALPAAIRAVIWADVVMSADNVLAVAAAAHGNTPLLIAGIVTSIPFVALGSGLLSRLIDRFPVLIAAGAGLLGWVAGNLMDGDSLIDPLPEWLQASIAPALALILLAAGLRALHQEASRAEASAHRHD